MEFKLVKPSEELLRQTAPGHVLRLYDAKGFETLTAAGFEGGKPVCYAVFSRMCSGGEPYLEYLYEAPGTDGEKNIESLMDYCGDYFSGLGFNRIISKKYVLPHEANDWHKTMKSLGFVPLYLSGRLMLYRLQDTEMAGVRPVILRNIKKLPEVCGFNTAGERRFRSFMKKIGRGDVSGMAPYIPYSFFYIAEDEINGAMLAQKAGPDSIHISVTSLDNTAVKDNVFLVLLTEVLTAAERDMGTDYSFMINVDSDLIYRGLMQVFNPPDQEFFMMEHKHPLGGEGVSLKGRLFPKEEELSALSLNDFDQPLEQPLEQFAPESAGNLDGGSYDVLDADPDAEETVEISDIMELLPVKENHMLSENGFLVMDRQPEEAGRIEERLNQVYSDFAEQEEKNRSAKKAKEYLLNFWDMRESLEADASLSKDDIRKRLFMFIKDISKDVEVFRELYVGKLGRGKRKERILQYLERFDEIMRNGEE